MFPHVRVTAAGTCVGASARAAELMPAIVTTTVTNFKRDFIRILRKVVTHSTGTVYAMSQKKRALGARLTYMRKNDDVWSARLKGSAMVPWCCVAISPDAARPL
jgi:hypothetical protein